MAEKTSVFADRNFQVDIITRSSFEPPASAGPFASHDDDDDDLSQSSAFYEPKADRDVDRCRI